MFQIKVLKKSKHIFYVLYRLYENRAIYEIKWKNIVETDRLQTTIWRIRIVSWTPKATKIHSEYVILIAFVRQQ